MSTKRIALAAAAVFLLVVIVVVVVVAVVVTRDDDEDEILTAKHEPVEAREYSKASVAADRLECSNIGRDMLKRNGSAIDAAVASLFCIGLLNMHSCGIGGGGFINFYKRSEKKAYIYDFRETAPLSASENMYVNKSQERLSTVGGMSIAVPGNVKGLHYVWQKHGKLPWGDLLDPTIKIATDGFKISKAVGDKIERESTNKLYLNEGFKEFLQKDDKTWYKTGEMLKATLLADTLKRIKANPHDFYNGTMADEIVLDINEAGGSFSKKDLEDYKVTEREPVTTNVKGYTIYSMPPPGSGAVIEMTMNILEGFNMSEANIKDNAELIKTTHKIIEALKFAFARRPLLGDPSFVADVSKVLTAMLNKTFAEELRHKIKDTPYPNQTFYGGFYSQHQDPYGTSHLSILSEDGDAVGATDTINYGFGSGVRSTRNGIIYNNEMDDFSTPGLQNLWGYLPAKSNFIKPGKRPLSSMSPTIVTNSDGDVVMVVGASGGSRIITATALTLIRTLYLNEELGRAVSEPRVHTHLLPYEVYINDPYTVSEELQDGLKDLGHKLVMSKYWAAIQAIYRKDISSPILAKCDPRKGGLPAGY